MDLRFPWDPRKAAANRRKHRVSFEEVATAFADPLSLTIPDPDHSAGEARFLLLGLGERRWLLVVAHAERGAEIRIISARIPDRQERRDYEEGSP